MTSWPYLRGLRYRIWARLLHRFNLHHTRRSGPMEDGAYLHRCDWCGVSRKEVPAWLTAKRMSASESLAKTTVGSGRSHEPSRDGVLILAGHAGTRGRL